MTEVQEDGRLLELETALNDYVLEPWSGEHAGRPGSPIEQRPYTREPDQRIDTFRTPLNEIPPYLRHPAVLSRAIEYKLAESFRGDKNLLRSLNSFRIARRMVRSFVDRPTSRSNQTPLMDTVSAIIEEGETLNVVDAHYEFTGGVRLLAALQAAHGQAEYIYRTNVLVSKTMTREQIAGKSITALVTPVGSVIWVVPDTKSYLELVHRQQLDEDAFRLVEEAANFVNYGSMKELRAARKIGGILEWAPFSSALIRKTDEAGVLTGLETPEIPSQVPNLLGKAKYVLPVAYGENPRTGQISWEVGDLIERDTIEASSRKVRDTLHLERVVGSLCTMQARISGVPVEHLGKVFEPN